jgi:hypothetical protein
MGTLVTSKREVKYTLSNDMSVVQSVMAEEVHNMLVEMWQDAGSSVRATQQIVLTGFVCFAALDCVFSNYYEIKPTKCIFKVR